MYANPVGSRDLITFFPPPWIGARKAVLDSQPSFHPFTCIFWFTAIVFIHYLWIILSPPGHLNRHKMNFGDRGTEGGVGRDINMWGYSATIMEVSSMRHSLSFYPAWHSFQYFWFQYVFFQLGLLSFVVWASKRGLLFVLKYKDMFHLCVEV